jgi:subtilisin family serine protease
MVGMRGEHVRRRWLVVLAAVLALALLALAPAPARATNDPFFGEQWPLAQIGAPAAWPASTGAGVAIGIVDTGVDFDHPDLRSKIDAVADCVGGPCREGAGRDGHGHGTLVAGIAAAATNNGRGMAGVAPDARLLVAKAVDDQGRGSVEDINNAIRWVVDKGAKVVNLSLGDPNFLVVSLLGTPLRPGIEYAWSRGAIPVLASGNENLGLLDIGSSNYGGLNAVVVGATDRSGAVAPYSSPIGTAKWGVAAPGGSGGGPGQDVLSTFTGGRYAWTAGTSMATPHVSGALALLIARGYTGATAVQRLLATLDGSVRCGSGCQGRINVAAAVGGAGPGAAPAPTAPPPPPPPPATAAPVVPGTPAPTTEPPAVTVPPPPDTTLPPPVVAEPTDPGPDPELAAGGAGSPVGGPTSRDALNPVLVATAISLVVAVAGGLGVVGVSRVTGVGGL